jgi:predicted RNase H-like HicB family nuclease
MADLSVILEKAPRECWLALTADETKVVGRGEDIAEAVEEAKENGENDPVLIWAPKAWIPAVY